MENFKQKLNHITCFILDLDGVLTNGGLTITPDGEWLRTMNIKDGYAIQLAIKKNYQVVILSGGRPSGITERLHHLGIKEVFMEVSDKQQALGLLAKRLGLEMKAILYMGDDVPDKNAMQQCGIATAPLDAVAEIREVCHYVSAFRGGEGCVRDVIEQTLRLHGKWE